jgi:hypothetical protein
VQIAGRLHAGKHAFGELGHGLLETLELLSRLMTTQDERRKAASERAARGSEPTPSAKPRRRSVGHAALRWTENPVNALRRRFCYSRFGGDKSVRLFPSLRYREYSTDRGGRAQPC